MKKKAISVISVMLALTMVFSLCMPASAAKTRESAAKGAKFVDSLMEGILDPVFNGLINLLFKADGIGRQLPTPEEFLAQPDEYFYEGTDGTLTGQGWKLGYAGASVIPASWRENADGKQDDNGMNLNKTYYFGGYFTSTVDKIYDDETVNLAVLSAGTDANGNGVEDIIIEACLDNIGFSNGNVELVRKAVAERLAKCGVANDDILAFNFSCTHAHSVVEALGMSLNTVFFVGLKNHFLFQRKTAVNDELLDSICNQTAAAAEEAYKGMESGTLSFFETQDLNAYMDANSVNKKPEDRKMCYDKLQFGADAQQTVACLYFESESGEKTVLGNMGMHPTFAGRDSKRVCGDFPYYFNKAMQDMGYNFVFLQGSQAAIGATGYYTQAGQDWAEANALTKDEWVSRYGAKYADKHYEEEQNYFTMKATGYSLAQCVVDGTAQKKELAPTVNIKMERTLVPLDYDVMYLAAVAGVFGYHTVKTPGNETGYSIVTEIGYMKLDDIVWLMLPGEVNPAVTFGRDDDFTGEESWSGATSWSGEEWQYKPLSRMAQEALGQDVKVFAVGLANDEIGYVQPDTDCAANFLTKTLTANMGYHTGRGNNEELMAATPQAGSVMAEAFAKLFGVSAK